MKEEKKTEQGCSNTIPEYLNCPESYPNAEMEIKKVSITQKPNERKGTWKYTLSFESVRQLNINEVFAVQNHIIPEYKFVLPKED